MTVTISSKMQQYCITYNFSSTQNVYSIYPNNHNPHDNKNKNIFSFLSKGVYKLHIYYYVILVPWLSSEYCNIYMQVYLHIFSLN